MGLRDDFVNLLKREAGYREGRNPDGTWNNIQKYSEETPGFAWSDGQPWCATFECWGAWKSSMTSMWPMTASCSTAVNWWQGQGRWTAYPVLGGPMYMGPGGGDHTGVVWKYDSDPSAPGGGGWIWTVEGNTNDTGAYQGDGVYLRQRPRCGPDSPYGYGVPAYPEGTISADPALGGTAAAEVAAAPAPQPAPSPAPSPNIARYQVTINVLQYGYGAHGDHVTKVGQALVNRGFGSHYQVGPGPDWGDADTLNYSDFQVSLGYTGTAPHQDADGVPGAGSLQTLLGYLPSPPAAAKAAAPAFPGRQCFVLGATNDHALQLQKWLARGDWGPAYRVGPSRTMTQLDLDKVKALQNHYLAALGPADGLTGPKTWRYAFEVANGLRKK